MYRQLNHTADLYFEVVGNNLDEIFNDSASAILEYIGKLDLESISKKEVLEFEGAIEDILIEYLNEILFHILVRGEYLIKAEVFINEDWQQNSSSLKASINCIFKRAKKIVREIKAISYHIAKLEAYRDKLIFRFIADI